MLVRRHNSSVLTKSGISSNLGITILFFKYRLMILYVVVKKNCKKKIMKGARFELARSTDQQITLVKKDLNLHLKSVTLDQLGQPSQFVVKKLCGF